MVSSPEQVAPNTKEIPYESVHREKPLRMRGGLESAHLSLALPRGLMRDLRSIVLVLPRAVDHGRHRGAVRRRITPELVRDQTARLPAVPFQQLPEETGGRPPVASRLDQNVNHVPVLVHGAPQILSPSLGRHKKLVQKPSVAHPAAPTPLNRTGFVGGLIA